MELWQGWNWNDSRKTIEWAWGWCKYPWNSIMTIISNFKGLPGWSFGSSSHCRVQRMGNFIKNRNNQRIQIRLLPRSISRNGIRVDFKKTVILSRYDLGYPMYNYRHFDMFDFFPSSRCWRKSRLKWVVKTKCPKLFICLKY